MNPEQAPSTLTIAGFTVAQLSAGPSVLGAFSDPHGYLAAFDDAGCALLGANPQAQPADLALVLALDRNTVVGRLGFFAGVAPRGSTVPRVLWLSGFFLQDTYRHSGAGGMLMLRALGARLPLLAAGGPNADLQKIYDSTGFTRLPPLKAWFAFFNSRPLLHRRIPQKLLRALLRPSIDLMVKAHDTWFRRPPSAAISFRPVARFGPELDDKVAKDNSVLIARDHRLLNWVLEYRPSTRGYLLEEAGQVIGYCILGTRASQRSPGSQERWGVLLDYWLARPSPKVMEVLLAFGCQQARAQGADAFLAQASDPALEPAARRLGMLPYGGNLVFYRGGRHRIDPSESWVLTAATADSTLFVD
jgi:hypothetical protein